jgi:hypothetical protein
MKSFNLVFDFGLLFSFDNLARLPVDKFISTSSQLPSPMIENNLTLPFLMV